MNALTLNTQAQTMTSREIADLTGKRHADVMRDVRNMLGELEPTERSFASSYIDSTGRELREFRLPKRETLILVSGYSVTMRAKIIDRWQELESQAAPAIPRTFVEAMRVALAQAEALEKAQAQVQALKPAALVGERVAAHKHTLDQIIRTFPAVYCSQTGFRCHSPPP